MKHFFSVLSLSAVLCFTSMLSAGETFTDPAEFAQQLTGTTISEDFDNLTREEIGMRAEPLFFFPGPQDLPWGTLSSSREDDLNGGRLRDGSIFLIADRDRFEFAAGADPIFNFNPAGNNLEGFCAEVSAQPRLTIFNGDEVVDTVVPDTRETTTICWLNTDNVNVTRIEVTADNFRVGPAIIFGIDFTFFPDPPETLQSTLDDLIADVGAIESTGNRSDDNFITRALFFLNRASGDLVDDDIVDSKRFFQEINKATRFLTRVTDNAEVTQVLEDIQTLLGTITEREIILAAAAGSDADSLALAEFYQESADYLQLNGQYHKAANYRKWANSTAKTGKSK